MPPGRLIGFCIGGQCVYSREEATALLPEDGKLINYCGGEITREELLGLLPESVKEVIQRQKADPIPKPNPNSLQPLKAEIVVSQHNREKEIERLRRQFREEEEQRVEEEKDRLKKEIRWASQSDPQTLANSSTGGGSRINGRPLDCDGRTVIHRNLMQAYNLLVGSDRELERGIRRALQARRMAGQRI